METIKILLVNTGVTPIATERFEFPETDSKVAQETILSGINRLGKNSHALVKYKGAFHVCDHTARKGPSKEYFRHAVKYHPYMGELS